MLWMLRGVGECERACVHEIHEPPQISMHLYKATQSRGNTLPPYVKTLSILAGIVKVPSPTLGTFASCQERQGLRGEELAAIDKAFKCSFKPKWLGGDARMDVALWWKSLARSVTWFLCGFFRAKRKIS